MEGDGFVVICEVMRRPSARLGRSVEQFGLLRRAVRPSDCMIVIACARAVKRARWGHRPDGEYPGREGRPGERETAQRVASPSVVQVPLAASRTSTERPGPRWTVRRKSTPHDQHSVQSLHVWGNYLSSGMWEGPPRSKSAPHSVQSLWGNYLE